MENEKPTFMQRLKKFFYKILIGVVLLLALTIWVCSWTYSEGTRAGQLIKVAKKGVIFKTFEGELNLGGLRMGDQVDALEGNIWSFSVIKEEVLDEVRKYEGKRVKLLYKQRFKSMPWQAKTNYIVVGVEAIDP
ncbi:6-phosphogluconate dehydrogenase [Winogradskyella aurantiaca]|uniref:6-phosphogluconate dehydrogenase n=1 Tax=Winogradskyella aurantiaca TaxID=2219558 RepID=UPI000E1C4F16|nr:6-phosphogluconate dehydrogenase [Winogradskyella aurantiaca]